MRLNHNFRLRLNRRQYEIVKKEAEDQGLSVSSYLRTIIFKKEKDL
jgi:predicted DNA binding CopG/RHH family protein